MGTHDRCTGGARTTAVQSGRAGQGRAEPVIAGWGHVGIFRRNKGLSVSVWFSLVSAGAARGRGRGLSRTRVWYGSPPVADFVKHATRAANNSADHIGVWHACHRARSHIIPIIHRLGLYSAAHAMTHAMHVCLYSICWAGTGIYTMSF